LCFECKQTQTEIRSELRLLVGWLLLTASLSGRNLQSKSVTRDSHVRTCLLSALSVEHGTPRLIRLPDKRTNVILQSLIHVIFRVLKVRGSKLGATLLADSV
jgi:hypothetical protein